jgi:protein TonB
VAGTTTMPQVTEQNRDRIKSMIGVAALHVLLGYALINGLGVKVVSRVEESLTLFDVAVPLPPPPSKAASPSRAEVERARPKDPEGAASAANLRDTPTEIVAPKPEIRLPPPPPIVAAPAAGEGNAAAAGAADVRGPGTGSGGQGTGLGSGLRGNGTGGGDGGRGARARWVRGRISETDYPRRAFEAGVGGTVYLRFVVAPDGRVSDCAVTRSSGSAELDATTCRLIKRRFHYRPARDAQGKAIADVVRGEHVWELGPEPPPIDVEPELVEPYR